MRHYALARRTMPGVKKDFSFGIVPFRLRQGHREYLLIQHLAGHWAFPKGHAEKGETPLESALREFREETGLAAVEVRAEPSLQERYVTVKKGVELDKTVTYFLGEVLGDPRVAVQAEEVRDHAWLPAAEAAGRITHPGCRGVLAEAERLLRECEGAGR